MFEKLMEQESFNEKDIAFVVKNMAIAPKELLVRLGLNSQEEVEEAVVTETSETDGAGATPVRRRRTA